METLKNKSGINIASAELLLKQPYANPSVHCSYYAAFQYLVFTVCKARNITKDELSQEIRSDSGKHSHNYPIQLIVSRARDIKAIDLAKFRRKITDLKALRETADYELQNVDYPTAEQALKDAADLIEQFKLIV